LDHEICCPSAFFKILRSFHGFMKASGLSVSESPSGASPPMVTDWSHMICLHKQLLMLSQPFWLINPSAQTKERFEYLRSPTMGTTEMARQEDQSCITAATGTRPRPIQNLQIRRSSHVRRGNFAGQPSTSLPKQDRGGREVTRLQPELVR
jgi:hypothetical protein